MILNSHSDLTRQIEELEAHACALRCSEGDKDDVLEDLVAFAQRFTAEVQEHIAEEEEVLFPQCYPYLTASARTLLHRIRNQHRDLEKSLHRFMEYLSKACEQPAPPRLPDRSHLSSRPAVALYLRRPQRRRTPLFRRDLFPITPKGPAATAADPFYSTSSHSPVHSASCIPQLSGQKLSGSLQVPKSQLWVLPAVS